MTDSKSPQPPNAPLLPPAELAEILRATAAAKLFDRFGRPILLGCDIELHGELPPVYSVIDARPNLTADVPGMWNLTVATQIQVICQQGRRHAKMTVVGMPPFAEQAEAATAATGTTGTPAASDTPAPAVQGSIILTDMDRTARQTLADAMEGTPAKTGPKLVPAPANDADDIRVPDEGEPAANMSPLIDHGGES